MTHPIPYEEHEFNYDVVSYLDSKEQWVTVPFCLNTSIIQIPISYHFRNSQEGYLEVDGRKTATLRAPGKLRQLNTDTGLYVGKYLGFK